MQLSRYIKTYPYAEDPDYLLFHSTKKASKILLHKSILESLERGDVSPSDKETLSDLGFLVPDHDEERREMLGIIDDVNRQNNRFTAMAVMNLDCNLACRYCYEGTLKGRHYMSSETADQLVSFVDRHHLAEGRSVSLDFYGGEPLLSFGLIKNISKRLKASAGNKGLLYTFSLVTNGTLLTADKVEELKPLGLKSAKITLDGLKENHDVSRPFRAGGPERSSFDTIIGNVKEVCSLVNIQIGGNFTRENFRSFPALLDYLVREGLTPERVPFVKFDAVAKIGGKFALPDFHEGTESINEPWLFDVGLFLREEILKRGFDTPRILPSPCMVELRNDLVVHFDGTFYKCPGMIGWKGFEAGDLTTGIKDYRDSYGVGLWKKKECLDCEYLPLCFGGCRYMKLINDGKIGVDCRKPYFDATLGAMIRQDLAYRKTG